MHIRQNAWKRIISFLIVKQSVILKFYYLKKGKKTQLLQQQGNAAVYFCVCYTQFTIQSKGKMHAFLCLQRVALVPSSMNLRLSLLSSSLIKSILVAYAYITQHTAQHSIVKRITQFSYPPKTT